MKRIDDIRKDVGNIYQETIRSYSEVYEIDLGEHFIGLPGYFVSYQGISDNMYNFFVERTDELREFDNDFYSKRTVQQLADKIGYNVQEVLPILKAKLPYRFYYNYHKGLSEDTEISNFSSLDDKYYIEKKRPILKIPAEAKEEIPAGREKEIFLVGYDDIRNHIVEQLEPVLNAEQSKIWGIRKPAGILLYGPPGCGKTYWAHWLASFLDLKFQEIPRSTFGSSYVDGGMNKLKEILDGIEDNSIIFFDEFDSIASDRQLPNQGSGEATKIVNTLLQEIPKLVDRNVLIIAATNFVNNLDPAIIRPGRFDLKLPIFPPLASERQHLIFESIKRDTDNKDLDPDSPLLQILRYNKADSFDYWQAFAEEMYLFSNSLVLDFCNLLKIRLKREFYNNGTNEYLIEGIVSSTLEDCFNKVTLNDLDFSANFYGEMAELNLASFQERSDELLYELEKFSERRKIQNPPRPIGFRIPFSVED